MFILSHSVTVSRREVLFLFIFNLPSSIFILSHGYLSWSLFLFILLSSFPCMFISSINLFSFCSSITHSLPVSRREVFIRFVLLFSVLYVYLFTSSIFILFIYHTQCLAMILFRFILLFSVLYVYLFTSSIAYLFVCFDAQIASLRSIHHLTSLDLSYGNCKSLSLFLLYLSVCIIFLSLCVSSSSLTSFFSTTSFHCLSFWYTLIHLIIFLSVSVCVLAFHLHLFVLSTQYKSTNQRHRSSRHLSITFLSFSFSLSLSHLTSPHSTPPLVYLRPPIHLKQINANYVCV